MIVGRKKKKEIAKRLAAVQLICLHYIDDIQALTKATENLAEIVYMACGTKGLDSVIEVLKQYNKSLNK